MVDCNKKLPSGTLFALYLIMKVTPSFSPGAIERYGINRGRRRVPAVPRHFPRAICSVLARLRKKKKEEMKTNHSITDKSRTTNWAQDIQPVFKWVPANHNKNKEPIEPIRTRSKQRDEGQARENASEKVKIGFGFQFTSHWSRKWRELFKPIKKVTIEQYMEQVPDARKHATGAYKPTLRYVCTIK